MPMQDKASRRRDCFLFVAGGILGAVAFLLVLGLSPLDVTQDAFCRGGFLSRFVSPTVSTGRMGSASPSPIPSLFLPRFFGCWSLFYLLPSSILACIPCSVWFCRGQSVHGCWVCLSRDVGCLLRGIWGLYSALFCGNVCCGILR